MHFFTWKFDNGQNNSESSQSAHNIKNCPPSEEICDPSGKGRTESRCKSRGKSYDSHNCPTFFRFIQPKCYHLWKRKKNPRSQSLYNTGEKEQIDIGRKGGRAHPIKNKETDTKYSFLEEKCSIRNPVQGIMTPINSR